MLEFPAVFGGFAGYVAHTQIDHFPFVSVMIVTCQKLCGDARRKLLCLSSAFMIDAFLFGQIYA